MAYGYKDINYFGLKIHQHCGLLNPRINTINATKIRKNPYFVSISPRFKCLGNLQIF